MKKIFAFASLALLTSVAWSHDKTFGGNPDMYGSPLMDHNTTKQSHAVQRGIGDSYGSQLMYQPADHSHKGSSGGSRFNQDYDPDGNRDIFQN